MKKRLAVIASALVVLAACGGSDSSESDQSSGRVKNAALLQPTTSLAAGGNMTAPTVVLASTTTIQSAGILGARWQGQTFSATYADTSKFAACTGVTAPALVAGTSPAHVQWASALSTPVNDNTVDLVLVETSTDNKTWATAGYNRLKANTAQLLDAKSGQKLFVRAAYYRTTATPCITARSTAVNITVK